LCDIVTRLRRFTAVMAIGTRDTSHRHQCNAHTRQPYRYSTPPACLHFPLLACACVRLPGKCGSRNLAGLGPRYNETKTSAAVFVPPQR
jgi:hypothetical protein